MLEVLELPKKLERGIYSLPSSPYSEHCWSIVSARKCTNPIWESQEVETMSLCHEGPFSCTKNLPFAEDSSCSLLRYVIVLHKKKMTQNDILCFIFMLYAMLIGYTSPHFHCCLLGEGAFELLSVQDALVLDLLHRVEGLSQNPPNSRALWDCLLLLLFHF